MSLCEAEGGAQGGGGGASHMLSDHVSTYVCVMSQCTVGRAAAHRQQDTVTPGGHRAALQGQLFKIKAPSRPHMICFYFFGFKKVFH